MNNFCVVLAQLQRTNKNTPKTPIPTPRGWGFLQMKYVVGEDIHSHHSNRGQTKTPQRPQYQHCEGGNFYRRSVVGRTYIHVTATEDKLEHPKGSNTSTVGLGISTDEMWEGRAHIYITATESRIYSKSTNLKIILSSDFPEYLLNVYRSPKCLLHDRATRGYLVSLWKVPAASGRFQISLRGLCKARFAYASQ